MLPVSAGENGATINGVVQVVGPLPTPREWMLDQTMQRATGEKVYRDETWLIGEDKGLANCVVTLKPKKAAVAVALKPLENAVLDKVGVRYVPHILVVTPGTEVVLRNKESPCHGFAIKGSNHRYEHDFNFAIRPGTEKKVSLRGPDTCSVVCYFRPFSRGHIVVVDTPHYALTNADGKFRIRGVPAGDYQVAVWHEGAGTLTKAAGPTELRVSEKENANLSFSVRPPAVGEK